MIKLPETKSNKLNYKRLSSSTNQKQEDENLLSERASSEYDYKTVSDYSEWCIVLNQNIIQADLTADSVINKIKSICEILRNRHPGIAIVFKL